MEGNQDLQKTTISKLSVLKKLKEFIAAHDMDVNEALKKLTPNNAHDDPVDAVDAPSTNYGRIPIRTMFKNMPFTTGLDDEEDTPPGRSVLTYKGIFYNFNSTTLFPQGRQAFMSQMGIKIIGQQSVVVNFTVPVMGNGWKKVEYKGSPSSKQTVTDPFARWEYNVRSFQQSLSVLTFESNFQVPDGHVPVRECMGAYITINRSLETLNLVNLNSIFPGASFEDYYPGQPGGKNSGIDAPNLFRDMETQYIYSM